MNHEVKSYISFDGVELRYREWLPPRHSAVVVYLHGIQSHSGWFLDSCSNCAANGFRVVSLDRRGSGLNEYRRGDAPNFRVLLTDIAVILNKLKSEGERAVHMVGVSWGGKLASCFAAAYPRAVRSLLLVAPGLAQRVGFAPLKSAVVALCSVLSPETHFDIPIERADMFTSNPDRIRFIESDPMRLKRCTSRMMVQSRLMDIFLRRNARRIRAPAMLMLAEHDPIVDNDRARALFAKFGSEVKVVREFEGAWHTLEFEKEKDDFLRAMVEWLRRFD